MAKENKNPGIETLNNTNNETKSATEGVSNVAYITVFCPRCGGTNIRIKGILKNKKMCQDCGCKL